MLGPIPAGAGEPTPHVYELFVSRAYPRGCGGTGMTMLWGAVFGGLSPRVRGNRFGARYCRRKVGPIPAGAGEPPPARLMGPLRRAYPRGCGGTIVGYLLEQPAKGLSPRVRGNLRLVIDEMVSRGPIPAGAGEPGIGLDELAEVRAYPRGCGGTDRDQQPTRPGWGLSPRVRGNPERPAPPSGSPGPIPAGAGEPLFTSFCSYSTRAYPRGCGGTARP